MDAGDRGTARARVESPLAGQCDLRPVTCGACLAVSSGLTFFRVWPSNTVIEGEEPSGGAFCWVLPGELGCGLASCVVVL